MRRNLILARVGSRSLDPEWLRGGRDRTWDLHLVPYEPIGARPPEVTSGPPVAGPKWSGLAAYLDGWDGWREYDYVWMPDDDLRATAPEIDRLFAAARGAGLDLFSPALSPPSYFAHFDTMHNASFHGRWVGFVEILCPGFSRGALEQLLFTLSLSQTGWGWGLDSVWPKLLEYRNVGIIDSVMVTHTRPVGAMRDPELRRRVHEESDRLLRSFECHQVHTTFDAFDSDFCAWGRAPHELVPDLAEGWGYLIERDPTVMRWITGFQRWPEYCKDYPCQGTPGGGYGLA